MTKAVQKAVQMIGLPHKPERQRSVVRIKIGDVKVSTGISKSDKRVEARRTLKKAHVLKLDDNNNFELAAA